MPFSRIAALLLSPDTIVFMALAAGLLGWALRLRFAKGLTITAAVLLLLIAYVPVGTLLLRPLENRFSPGDIGPSIDGIVMLGGAERAGLSKAHGFAHVDGKAERLMRAAALAHSYPDVPVLLTGGRYSPDVPAQAQVAADFLKSVGIDEDRLLIETRARSTFDSAVYSYRLAQPVGEAWVLVTSAYHMPRSIGAFRRAGWTGLIPAPTDYRAQGSGARFFAHRINIDHLYLAAHEWMGMAYYRLKGRAETFFPAP